MDNLYNILYPLPSPQQTRTPSKPLSVLALGLPRTGTDSLRAALEILGYSHVYHGFDIVLNSSDCKAWFQLLVKSRDTQPTQQDFDQIIGHCQAVTDQPCCLLGNELIDAFPNAKVILNKRKDVDSWFTSLMAITAIIEDWSFWARSFVDAEEFWNFRVLKVGWVHYFGNNYRKNGKEVYEKHYRDLEEKMKMNGREYLEWTVEDGWEPLCRFLGKSVPSEEFPSGNNPQQFYVRMGNMMKERKERGNRKLFVGGVLTAAVIAFAVGLSIRSGFRR